MLKLEISLELLYLEGFWFLLEHFLEEIVVEKLHTNYDGFKCEIQNLLVSVNVDQGS